MPEEHSSSCGACPVWLAALEQVHRPDDSNAERLGRFRLKFEEFLFLQLLLVQHRNQADGAQTRSRALRRWGAMFNRFYEDAFPSSLTGAQKAGHPRDPRRHPNGQHMNRLAPRRCGQRQNHGGTAHGLMAVDNGCQVCIMAPTEILAQQHLRGSERCWVTCPCGSSC